MSFDRANRVLAQMQLAPIGVAAAASASAEEKKEGSASGRQSLTVVDNRSGKSMELPIKNGTVVATKFLDFGLKSVARHAHTRREQRPPAGLVTPVAAGCSNERRCGRIDVAVGEWLAEDAAVHLIP